MVVIDKNDTLVSSNDLQPGQTRETKKNPWPTDNSGPQRRPRSRRSVGDSGPVLTMRSMLTLIALFALLVGCGSRVTVEFDEDLEKAIGELARSGGVRPLRELAPGDWTSVHVITGPGSGARIERELGRPAELEGDGTYDGDYVQDGDLLVFLRDGEIVRMVSLGQFDAFGDGEYGADVVLQARGGAMAMTDPDGRPTGR